jgi:uncharacterized protein YeaO (DUF488 family)
VTSAESYPRPVAVRRIYDPPEDDGGYRVLIDRLWPRGIAKDRARVDEWLKAVAPSDELRRWVHKDKQGRFAEFARRYEAELGEGERAEALDHLRELAAERPITLVTAVKDIEHSHVPVLVARIGRQAA